MTRFTTLIQSTTFRVAGAVAAVAVAAPLTVPADAAEGIHSIRCGKAQTVSGSSTEWQRFPAPVFQPGIGIDTTPQEIVSYAVSPTNTNYLAVTNGKAVYTSKDGGCDWSLGFRLGRLPEDPQRIPLSGLVTNILSVYVQPGTNAFFALAEEFETGATVGRPHVLRSTTGNPSSWQVVDEGLPPLGKPRTLRGHRTNGNVLYLSFQNAREEQAQCPPEPVPCDRSQNGEPLGLLYASTDGGRTWSTRTDPGDLNSASTIRYFSVDDNDSGGNTLYVIANGLLRKSTNGGRAYAVPQGVQQNGFRFTAVESLANTPASYGLEVVAFGANADGPAMIRLHNGEWLTTNLPFFASVASVAQRSDGDIAVATATDQGPASLWRIYPRDFIDFEEGTGQAGRTFKATLGWEPITPSIGASADSLDIQGGKAATGKGTYYVREKNALLRFLGSTGRLTDPTAPGVDLDPPKPPLGRISPASLELDLGLGQTRTVDYTLTLPPSPTPLDVYLLVDNSGSMIPFINDLKANLRDVALSLHETGVNVGIGVGQINVQPERDTLPVDDPRTPDEDESKGKPIYRNLWKIGPVNDDLFEQLSRLNGNSGAGDEPQLEALYQSVTGEGLTFAGLPFLGPHRIPPGHDAGFRDELGPIKVIVHATDENFSQNIRGGARNDFDQVALELNNHGVKQIGLSQGQTAAAEDLAYIAKATGAIAPPGGTDCDGDGRIGYEDVPAGEPLVCGQSEGLDRTLVNLLQSLSDPQTITLSKKASPTMVEVSREEFRIDAKQTTKVSFSVTYSCKGLAPGQYENDLTAALRGDLIAKAVATVTCGGLAVPVKPPGVALPEEPASNPPPVQPQPIVPAPVPVNPVPQPQTQVQTQTQVNPQAGMADQEEQQFQLAGVTNDLRDEGELSGDQLAMSGLSYDDAALGVMAVGMGMATALGIGLSVRRRHRPALAKVRAGRF
ncbi:MAG TPA: hypothetical protein VNA20_08875 [Frankiaceae bacterium]|nr:hypothetical protein [Frankiaceae bacterium]